MYLLFNGLKGLFFNQNEHIFNQTSIVAKYILHVKASSFRNIFRKFSTLWTLNEYKIYI